MSATSIIFDNLLSTSLSASFLLTSIITPSGNLTPFTIPDLSISTLTQVSSLSFSISSKVPSTGFKFSLILFRAAFLGLFLIS